MSNTEFVMVPRDALQDSVNGAEQEQGRARNKLRSLLEQPAEQHQGEPVACASIYVEQLDGHLVATVRRFDARMLPVGCLVNVYKYPADPGEVERLRGIIRMHEKTIQEQVEQLACMRKLSVTNILMAITPGHDGMGHEHYADSVAEVEQKLYELSVEVDEQRAQLAERDALLGRVMTGYKFQLVSTLRDDIEAALSASAEPSASSPHPINMKTVMQAYEHVDHKALLHGTSNWCASMATALRGVINSEPSAPVERDERGDA